MILTESHSDANCGQADGIATVSVSGGTTPYSYLWSTGDVTSFISNVQAFTYLVTVTDMNGCMETMSITVADVAGRECNGQKHDSASNLSHAFRGRIFRGTD